MLTKILMVMVEPGLQARPASEFVQKANYFSSDIFLLKGSRRVNAKSIMGLLSLAISSGETITLTAEGADSEEAINTLTKFLSNESNTI